MATYQTAEIGTWFISLDGQFLRVWGLAFEQEVLSQVIVQPLNGTPCVLELVEWQLMDLVPYPMADDDRGSASLPLS